MRSFIQPEIVIYDRQYHHPYLMGARSCLRYYKKRYVPGGIFESFCLPRFFVRARYYQLPVMPWHCRILTEWITPHYSPVLKIRNH